MVDYHIFFSKQLVVMVFHEFDTYKPTRIFEFCTILHVLLDRR